MVTRSKNTMAEISTGISRFFEDTELNQSIFRILMANTCVLYLYVISNFDISNAINYEKQFYIFYFVYTILSLFIIFSTYRNPGHYPSRRILGMIGDFSSSAFLLALGDERMLPVYAGMMFAVTGHGMRYGLHYLGISLFFALTGLAIVIWVNSFWQNNPYLAATLIISLFVIPIYAFSLLNRLRTALARAEAADVEKSNFLARASHDLRQPINAIGLLSERLEGTDLSPNQSSMVGMIKRSVGSAGDLFQSLLDISIIESGGLKPQYRATSLANLFDGIKERNKLALESAGIKLRVVSAQQHIVTDGVLLMTILQNVISNATKYAPKGDILMGCRYRNGEVSIVVCDRGPGIAEEDLAHITNEFFRSPNNAIPEVKGSGLGLAIVKQLARKMNLQCDIRSTLGRGTTVEIGRFRLTSQSLPSAPQTRDMYPRQLDGMEILLLDDDSDTLHAGRSLLEQWGCDVVTYDTIPDDPDSFDVIISDFDFGSGNMLSDHLDWIDDMLHLGIPIIVVSGHPKEWIEYSLKRAGISMLTKPVRPAELRSLLMAIKVKLTAQ